MEKLIEQKVIDSFDSALDIGCNSGAYSKIISDFGFRYVLGIDIVDEKIEKVNGFFSINGEQYISSYILRLLNIQIIQPS